MPIYQYVPIDLKHLGVIPHDAAYITYRDPPYRTVITSTP